MIYRTKRPKSVLFIFHAETLVLFHAESSAMLAVANTGQIDAPVFGKERDNRKGFAFWKDITVWV